MSIARRLLEGGADFRLLEGSAGYRLLEGPDSVALIGSPECISRVSVVDGTTTRRNAVLALVAIGLISAAGAVYDSKPGNAAGASSATAAATYALGLGGQAASASHATGGAGALVPQLATASSVSRADATPNAMTPQAGSADAQSTATAGSDVQLAPWVSMATVAQAIARTTVWRTSNAERAAIAYVSIVVVPVTGAGNAPAASQASATAASIAAGVGRASGQSAATAQAPVVQVPFLFTALHSISERTTVWRTNRAQIAALAYLYQNDGLTQAVAPGTDTDRYEPVPTFIAESAGRKFAAYLASAGTTISRNGDASSISDASAAYTIVAVSVGRADALATAGAVGNALVPASGNACASSDAQASTQNIASGAGQAGGLSQAIAPLAFGHAADADAYSVSDATADATGVATISRDGSAFSISYAVDVRTSCFGHPKRVVVAENRNRTIYAVPGDLRVS